MDKRWVFLSVRYVASYSKLAEESDVDRARV